MRPAPMTSTRERYAGRKRLQMASIKNNPLLRASAAMRAACSALRANGFSHSTCLPACSRASVSTSWRECGVATYAASTSGSAANAS